MTREPLRSWTKDDFIIDWFSGQGAGGQHRNKHQNCLRLTDKETGITVVAQNSRSRKQNMKEALSEMGNRLVEHHWPKHGRERTPVDETIRSFNEPDDRAVDHASGEKWGYSSFDLDEAIVKRKLEIE